ncbi:hypothetical protein G4D82_02675 [Flavobacterium sp. CYK-4]|uniref:hypothetical protein n=1 Tax=Flavobacterium lotistagni TaxID=2709660 RepID=UPI00140A9615|nr:hypothetical protein [Flavobacterium lotistagni]NHM06114.1 hypothetical protein [Flavobacterium lotistagni]
MRIAKEQYFNSIFISIKLLIFNDIVIWNQSIKNLNRRESQENWKQEQKQPQEELLHQCYNSNLEYVIKKGA